MCGVFCGLRLDVGGASWAARILAAALILALVPTTPTAGWLLCAGRTLEMSCFGWQRCVNCGGAWSVVEGAGGGMAVARVWKGVCIVVCGVVWCQDCMYFLCVCVFVVGARVLCRLVSGCAVTAGVEVEREREV